MSSDRSCGASSSLVLPRNALHCVCFWVFSANAAVSATGTAVGKEVCRRVNVALIAEASVAPHQPVVLYGRSAPCDRLPAKSRADSVSLGCGSDRPRGDRRHRVGCACLPPRASPARRSDHLRLHRARGPGGRLGLLLRDVVASLAIDRGARGREA